MLGVANSWLLEKFVTRATCVDGCSAWISDPAKRMTVASTGRSETLLTKVEIVAGCKAAATLSPRSGIQVQHPVSVK